MRRGDLVFANYDEIRGIKCVGLVLEVEKREVKVMWSSRHSPIGWWKDHQLRVISENR
jgi:hypothetical protein